jgi:predicted permease
MEIFLTLFVNLIPLYALIALGWCAGRFFDVDRKSLGALGIYIFMPIMAFGFLAQLDFKPEYIGLPVLIWALFSGLTLIWYAVAKKIYPDKRANLLAMCATAGNTGYFGLPVAIMLFPPDMIGLYIFILMGGTIYEATVYYYVAARGKFTVQQSLIKLAKFPTLYAVAAGLAYNFSGFELHPLFETYWGYIKGAYVVVGMMIIGVALSRVKGLVISPRFISLSFLGKFVVFPVVMLAVIYIDVAVFGFYDTQIHKMLFLMAIVPIAANIAVFAVEMDLNPEKAASTILLSTVFALFSIPVMLMLFDWLMAVSP